MIVVGRALTTQLILPLDLKVKETLGPSSTGAGDSASFSASATAEAEAVLEGRASVGCDDFPVGMTACLPLALVSETT